MVECGKGFKEINGRCVRVKSYNPFKLWQSYVGAVIGFLLALSPFFIFRETPEIGFALQPLLIISIPLLIIGFFLGFFISSKQYDSLIISLLGFGVGILYFLIKYFPYIKLPRIEQRGFGNELFISLGIAFFGFFIGYVLTLIWRKIRK